ncbi:angiopoietin-related protein 5 isoform X1 [Gadus chalcogrammus]|uniref:angiopoietin-related protein 5 isoform X1 n=2 Tax=Gadus chalcogrammus TaxID=1042646 RepID=UPI0024C24787|nr:angiopoietin-related protein 5 isoform X1 [Gadus chalcogrammus]
MELMWPAVFLLQLLYLPFSANVYTGSGNRTSNQSDVIIADLLEVASSKTPKSPVGGKGQDVCSIPCDVTAKLLRDDKNSLCGQIQQSLLAYGRSTRKMIRDVMDEQQRALDFLTTQVTELITKMQTLSLEVQRSNTEMYAVKPVQSHGRDCSDIKDSLVSVVPKIPSGIYIAHPENSDSSFEVFCEMDYMGGGWTVIQRRAEGLMDFKRPWEDYINGFGHLPGEHWLGLSQVHQILNQKETRFQLHIALVSHDDETAYASYDDVHLGGDAQFYSIHLGRYTGSAGDAFRGYEQEQNQDTAPFSATDVDNDGCVPSCSIHNRTVESCSAQYNHTGWWFNQCGLANLNGSPGDRGARPGGGGGYADGGTHILWDTWTQNGVPHLIKSVTMKIRRIPTNN